MYAADDEQHPRLRERMAAAAAAPAALWQVAVIAGLLALVMVITGAAVGSRVTRLDAKIETVLAQQADAEKRVKALDGKIEALRAAGQGQAQAQPQKSQSPSAAQPQSQSPSTSQTTAAPGQIVPKRKP
jgi:TolA-binding protein